jgi:L-ascorbate metabolism protein UlaG (beta-lactamase superfamily)
VRLAVLALPGLAAGCRSAVPMLYQVEPVPAVVGCAAGARCDDTVEITYLGVSGFVIRRGGAIVLTGPSFTNPPLDAVAPAFFRVFRRASRPIHPDTLAIERLLPPAADSASLLLVGHGHYDHLLDVPYVATRRATRATIVSGPSVRHMLMGDSTLRAHRERVVALDSADAGTVARPGRWYYAADSSVRVMALAADHAPTLRLFRRGPTFAAGVVREDLAGLPRRAGDWKLGEPYSYLVDFLAPGGRAPLFRVYFQDAPSTPPLGFPPRALLAEKGVDVALLCVATARNVPHAPDSLLTLLRPRYVVAGHWESFFRQQTLPLELNPASDVDAFLRALGDVLPARSGWVMPVPRTTVRVAVTGER